MTLPPLYPLRDFFQNPERSAFQLSDDGKKIAYLEPRAVANGPKRLNIVVQAIENGVLVGEAQQLTHETERDISQYFWKGDHTILFAKDQNGDENFHVLAVNVNNQQALDLTPFEGARAGIQDELIDDPEHVLIAHNRDNPEVFNVYKVNIASGEEQLVAENPGNIVGWETDHTGHIRLAITSDGLNTALLYRDPGQDEFQTIIDTDFKTTVSPLFFTADNQRFYALSNRQADTTQLVLIDPHTPDQEEHVYGVADYDLAGAAYSHEAQDLVATFYEADRLKQHFFNDKYAQLHQRLEHLLPGYELSLQSHNRAETRFVVAAHNDRTPGKRYLYCLETDQLSLLAVINPTLAEHDMAAMQPIQLQASDGQHLEGYLTLPVGRETKALPLIVNPHGGPWARDSWGFNPEVQFLANRGYAVLQINFRGSTGYGRRFWEASFGQWGLRMQDDISDAVQWAIDQGIADPARIAIYGGSYGGYATLMGITKTPDLYAAAVDYVGVSNLLTFMNTIPPYWKPLLEKMYAMVGHPEHDLERLTQTSPALQAHKIKTPLFVAQGAHDPRVNIAESDQMVDALRARGVEVDYLVKDNEGHGFHNDENKFEFYEKMEAFLRQHLLPEPS